MRLSYASCLLRLFIATSFSTRVRALPKLKESIQLPHGWVKVSPAPAGHVIDLRIGLPQSNFPLLEKHLYEVSDPYHERYGQHLSKTDVEALVAPHPESVSAVDAWLEEHGISAENTVRSSAGDWISVKVPVRLAETMLNTVCVHVLHVLHLLMTVRKTYHVWEHIASGSQLVRTTSYSLPEHIYTHVDVVQPTTLFALWKGLKATLYYEDIIEELPVVDSLSKENLASGAVVDPSCNATVTLSCLKQLYNIGNYTPQATKDNAIGITGYLEQFVNDADLQLFYQDQLPQAVNSSYTFHSVKGGLNNQTITDAGIEANLDAQFAFGLSYPTPGTFWSTAGRPPFKPDINLEENTNEPYAEDKSLIESQWIEYVLAQKKLPQSISTSYGDYEQTVPESYARRTCEGFAQLGARGISVLFSSGDGGVGDGNPNPVTQTCLTNDGRNATRFVPIFPAACPYVTSVGGTNNVPEIAVFFSGGGFSNYFPRPKYQDKAVKGFFDKFPENTYKDLFNRSASERPSMLLSFSAASVQSYSYMDARQAIPDVAALGRRFRIFWQGKAISIGGTSASAPTFAAVVALLNDDRLSKKKSPLGFLNPLLYTKGLSGFNDITEGNNPGCGTQGFNATVGWDPGDRACPDGFLN
ncbi:hypothetical protein H0H87_006874 [Tephrocybe sp. NHM501043]|nr:hypothetical protein H0H87_006874 [Tephrocybe sp. NHM501043]